MINFNEAPFLGKEIVSIKNAINTNHISGDGNYTKLCSEIIEKITGSAKVLLVHSGTAALEIAALLLDIRPGDEVICPSYTFVTTASSFALRGAKIIFVDIREETLNMDERKLEEAITDKTKAIIPVHYAGVACKMESILSIAKKYNIAVVEDAAQAIGSFYKGKSCGSIADLGCYSFHETKNISSGEGGALLVNNSQLIERAEIIREKGTNRSQFFRGQVNKYSWVALGSSYLPSDIIAAYLYPQLQNIENINARRMNIWKKYYQAFKKVQDKVIIPFIPDDCCHNAHMFHLRFQSFKVRTDFICYMKKHGVMCLFHYIPLHSSPAGMKYGCVKGGMDITNKVSETLVRLPIYYGLDEKKQDYIIQTALNFIYESV
jgi:dTDP-4-amino-4,6-dideoxygalactose transaminase